MRSAGLWFWLGVCVSEAAMFGAQTGPPSSFESYAGSMVYDRHLRKLFFTGVTYPTADHEGQCWVGSLAPDEHGEWTETISQLQVCTDLAYNNEEVMAAGYNHPSDHSTRVTARTMTIVPPTGHGPPEIEEHVLSDSHNASKTIYPVALAYGHHGHFYLATEEVEDGAHLTNFNPRVMDPTRVYPINGNFRLGLHKVTSPTMSKVHRTAEDHRVIVGDLLYVTPAGDAKDVLLVAGSTHGSGAAFGGEGIGDTSDDSDGFITKFDPDTLDVAPTGVGHTHYGTEHTYRIASQPEKDDHVQGLCQGKDDTDFVYVVGNTNGKMHGDEAGGIFLMKLELDSLTPRWTRQVAGDSITAITCAVSDDGSLIYVGGDVAGDGTVIPQAESFGGKDIFVIQYNPDGHKKWIKQFGTSSDEELARRGGLVVDSDDNAIVFGNRKANRRAGQDFPTQVFAVSLNKNQGESVPLDEFLPTPVSASSSSGRSPGQKFGIFVGVAVGVSVLGFLIYRRKKKGASMKEHLDERMPSMTIDDVEKELKNQEVI